MEFKINDKPLDTMSYSELVRECWVLQMMEKGVFEYTIFAELGVDEEIKLSAHLSKIKERRKEALAVLSKTEPDW